jgi:hypothetical protein
MPQSETFPLIPQFVVDYTSCIVCWSVTLFRFAILLKREKRNRRNAWIGLFALSASLFGLFELDGVYVAVDRLVGLNNLAWLLAYLCLATAVYAFCTFCSRVHPRWMLPGLFVTAGSLAVVFPFGPGRVPEWPNHFVPHNAGEILFSALAYGYVSILIGFVVLRPFGFILRRGEGDLLARLRTFVGMAAAVTTVAFYVLRFSVFSLGFFVPSLQPFAASAGADAYRALTLITVAFWGVFFGASDRFYLALARPVRFGQKVRTLRRLNAFRAQLDRFAGPHTPLPSASWLDRLRSPDFYIYQTLIGILDSRRRLLARGALWGEGKGESAFDGANAEKIAYFSRALRGLPDSLEFDDLVKACCRLAASSL